MLCGQSCLLNDNRGNPNRVIWVGSSKQKNLGYVYGDRLLIERFASDWTSGHMYGISVSRKNLNINDDHISILCSIKHKNIMRVYRFCKCTVEVEYISNAWLFNSHKESYILFHEAYQYDFLDNCRHRELIHALRAIHEGLKYLHNIGILHTDLTDFNVMVDKETRRPIIIDLLGSIPVKSQIFDFKKDIWVFIHHFLVPTLIRTGLYISSEINFYFIDYSHVEVSEYLSKVENRLLSMN
ncbi:protein kinase [Paenibacillus polymyxa]|uniref:protein kinase domain-containing protein n=1 Tax=Paenibacillus polymyxa TaxID=1406 RepID=UPI001BE7FECA|nr:protein kinase [Paenibacillus polymyxa]MBT2282950.1 protein kinase [Paenibacillus polymyxa]